MKQVKEETRKTVTTRRRTRRKRMRLNLRRTLAALRMTRMTRRWRTRSRLMTRSGATSSNR